MTDRLVLEELADGSIRVGHQRAGATLPEAQGPPFPFAPPLGAEALEDLRWYLEDYLIAPYAVYEDRGRRIEGQLEAWGEAMFAAAFGGNGAGRLAYERAMEAEGGAELAIVGGSATFLGLPWELLKDPARADPLALRLGAVDRLTATPAAPMAIPPGKTLRVLMVVARPEGLSDVGFQMVARPLMERLDAVRGRVTLEVLRPPSFEALAKRLSEAAGEGQPFHVLHFDGHGTFGADHAVGFGDARFDGLQGFLAFERPTGGVELVTAGDFARVVTGAKVPVVVLNACRSGTLSQGAEVATVEAAVATRLLHAGATSVVAMGYSVYAVAAAEFMAAFYETLFTGRSVSAAVAAGRARLKAKPERPSPKGPLPLRDWIVPVHYTRRAVAFPQLRRARKKAAPPLDAMLDAARRGGAAATAARDPLAPDRRFIGRDRAFYALELALRTERMVLLRGTAGAGKTELAKAFGRWWRDTGGVERPEWVLFHSFAPGTTTFGLDAPMTEIGLAVYGPDFVLKAPQPARRATAVLRLLRERRLLLIWDNLESVLSMPDAASGALPQAECDRLRDFLRDLSAPGGASGVILTSRADEDWLGGNLRRIEVGGLAPAEAAEMAEDVLAGLPIARQQRQERSFAELMQWLEGHPLSLRVLLPKLETMPPTALLAALKGATASLPPGFEGAERTAHLGASLKVSLDQLDPAMRARTWALALFEGVADEDILAVFSAAPDVPARFAGVAKAEWRTALDRLAVVGLVTPLELGMAGLHPALPAWLTAEWRAVAGAAFTAERAAADRALQNAYAAFGTWAMQQIQHGSAEAAFVLLDRQRRTLSRTLQGALASGDWGAAQDMLEPLSKYLEAGGLRTEAQAWAEAALAAVERADQSAVDFGGPAGALWRFVRGDEANRALQAGDLEGAESHYDSMRRWLEAEGSPENRRSLLVTYHNLGIAAQERGDLSAAEGWYRRSLEIKEALGDRPGMARSYHQLGWLAHRRDDLSAAEGWYRRSLEIKEALGDQSGMAYSYGHLGMVAELRGDLAAAERWYRRTEEISAALGDRPSLARAYHQLGIVAQLRGDLAAAEGWYRRALEIREALGDRPDLALTYAQLGVFEQARGRTRPALEWAVRCVALFDDFPDPRTGTAPRDFLHLTRQLGWPVLEATWRRVTGTPLPDNIRAGLQAALDHPDAP